MVVKLRGFGTMRHTDPERQRKLASKGGIAAHEKGTAHQFTPEEARAASMKRKKCGGPGATKETA